MQSFVVRAMAHLDLSILSVLINSSTRKMLDFSNHNYWVFFTDKAFAGGYQQNRQKKRKCVGVTHFLYKTYSLGFPGRNVQDTAVDFL